MFNDIKATNKRIAKQIKSIAGRNKTLRNMIQSTLCEIAAHAYQHGDVTHYNTLLDAIRGQDRKAIIDWIEEYGFARIRPDGTFGKAKAAVDAADYADAQAVFDEYTAPDTTIKPWFDFVKSVKQIAKDMTMPQLLNALMAKAAEHADPDGGGRQPGTPGMAEADHLKRWPQPQPWQPPLRKDRGSLRNNHPQQWFLDQGHCRLPATADACRIVDHLYR